MHVKSNSKRIGILGASGCGKSMTLKCIAGIETPDQGQIVLEERILYDNTQKINIKPQKRKIGYLFQNYALFPTMSVRKNIMAGLRCSAAYGPILQGLNAPINDLSRGCNADEVYQMAIITAGLK